MYLDQRGWLILLHIVNDPAVTGKELESKLSLSRKQLGYSIDKINDYLNENGLSKIERLRTGKFRIPSLVMEHFQSNDSESTEISAYTYSDKERGYFIMLMLLCSEEELSIVHFTTELEISKNTLILDLKKLQETIADSGITIHYSRKEGYTLLGCEYAKRGFLNQVIRKILEVQDGRERLKKISGITANDIAVIRKEISAIEKKLHIQFTDERLNELPFILLLILLRIKQGHYITDLPEAFKHIVGTKEYAAVVHLTNKYGIDEPLEQLFLTAQIQISNMSSFDTVHSDVEKQLVDAAKQVINNFELICCINIKEKELLLEALIQHWKPAYYRINYHYHIDTTITDMILPYHNYLHEIVKKASVSFEQMLQKAVPEEELVYITLLFGSWLKREGMLDFVEEKKRAVVVCANGISVSNFLFISLRELFPEIEFLTWLSVREFREYDNDYNIVFTTERLNTDKTQFLVSPFLNEYSKQVFREKVFRKLGGVNPNTIRVTHLMDIIEQHSTIHERDQLVKSLDRYINDADKKNHFLDTRDLIQTPKTPTNLVKLLTRETIKVLDTKVDWQSAIELGAKPFVDNHCFEPSYVHRMIEIIEVEKPFIMVAEGVVIAHAGIEDGVRQLGMGLVKLPEKIVVGGYMDADIIIILGTPDNTIHLGALYQMNEILEDKQKLDALHKAATIEEIIKLIQT